MAFVITQTDLPQGLSWKKLIFLTLLWKHFCLLLPSELPTINTQQASKWKNAWDWMQQSWVAYCKNHMSEEKLPAQVLLTSNLQSYEACTFTPSFVTLPLITVFHVRRSFSYWHAVYVFLFTPGFYLVILFTLQTTAKMLNNVPSHLQSYSLFCTGNSSLRNKAYRKYRLFNHILSWPIDKSYWALEKACI